MLKPVVTKPNTLPNCPSGVTERTIMSREGCIRPLTKPLNDIMAISSATPRSNKPNDDGAARDPGNRADRDPLMPAGARRKEPADQHPEGAEQQVRRQCRV